MSSGVNMACMTNNSKALVEPDWSVQFLESKCLTDKPNCLMCIENA